jgi:hypothetical protein
MTSLIDTIKTDLAAFGAKIEAEAETVAVEVYDVLKVAVVFIGSSQAKVIIDLLAKIEADAGKSLEQIETDVLAVATSDELAILKSAGSQLIQGLIAFAQATKSV